MTPKGADSAGIEELLHAAERSRRAGRLAEARTGFMDAGRAAERCGDRATLVAAGLGVGGLWVQEHRDVVDRAAVHALRDSAQQVVSPASIEYASLEVRRIAEVVYEGGSAKGVAEAVERVRAFDDDRATAEALSLFHHVQLGPGHGEARRLLAEEMILHAARAGDDLLALMGLCWLTVDLYLLGHPRADQSLTELRERSSAVGCEAIGFIADVLDAMLLARAGQLDQAERKAASTLERGLAVGDPDAPAYYGAMLAALRWWQGRASEVVDAVRSLSISPRLGLNHHVYVAADALLSATIGDQDAAEEALARLLSMDLSSLPDSSSWLTAQFLVVEAAFLLGDEATARQASQLLKPYMSLPVMPSLAVVCLGSTQRSLGLAATMAGDLDGAVGFLSAAIRADRSLGSRPMATLTEQTLAQVLRARGASGDMAQTARLAQRAEEKASRMGMVLPAVPSWLATMPTPTSPRPRHVSFLRLERGWKIAIDGRATIMPERVGFTYLARLLDRPDHDHDVMSIATDSFVTMPASHDLVLDGTALRSYRRRCRELTEMLERGDLPAGRAAQCESELASLRAALRSGTGFGGRSRPFPDNAERARTAVRKALVRAISMVGAAEPELGDHLQASIATGTSCRYRSEAAWSVSVFAKSTPASAESMESS